MVGKAGMMAGVTVLVLCGTAFAQYPYSAGVQSGSVGVKLIGFLPNSDSDGLKGFSTGIGVGVDSRFDFWNYFALGVELDYIGVSSASEAYYDQATNAYYSYTEDFGGLALKLDALGTIPLNNITPFFGLGLVYNNSTFNDTYYGSTSGVGIGLELVGGADFLMAGNGGITLEISVPINQYSDFDGVSVNVGGIEVMVGYRFLF